MARIPSSDGFGQVVAEPQRPDRRRDVTAASMGAGIAGAVRGIAMTEIAQQRQLQQVADLEAARTRDAADRANAARAVQGGRDRLTEAHDDLVEQVRTGAIPKDEAAARWNERVTEIRTASLEGVPTKYAPDATADFDSQTVRLVRGVNKAVTQRNQADVRTGLNSTLETAQRLYMKNPAEADAMVDGAFEQLGPYSGMTPDDLAKAKQGWRENTRFTKASEMVVGARRDNKSLSAVEKALAGPEFADMDPQRKITLTSQIEGFKVANIQKAEAEAARARAAQEAALRRAEAAYGAASSLVMGGKTLSPEYVTQLTEQTRGTPFAQALPDLLKQAPERSAFGMQPLRQMEQTVTQLRANLNVKGTDPATEKRVNQLEAIVSEKRKLLAEDPLLGAQEYGGPPVAQIDTSSIGGLVATVAARREAVDYASGQLGGQPVSPLTRQEAESVGKMIGMLPVEQRASAIAQVAQTVGPQQAAALGRQMGPKDNAVGIALSLAGDRTTAGRYTSEIVLRGDQAIRDKAVKKDSAAITGVRARVAAEIGDAYPDQSVREAVIEAAVLAQYGLEAEGGGDIPRAVRLVSGGITERAGRKVPLPRGMEPDAFDKRLKTLGSDSLRVPLPDGKVHVSGTAVDATEFLKQVPNAALIHAGQGRYAVQTGAGIATNSDGRPLIFEVK